MIKVGDLFPSTLLTFKGVDVELRSRLDSNIGILFGVPGAFDPLATETLLPKWKNAASHLKAHGVSFIGCLAVNDPFVLKGWSKRMKMTSEIVFVSDANGSLTKALGMHCDRSTQILYGGLVPRSRYFVIAISGDNNEVLAVLNDVDSQSERVVETLCNALDLPPPISPLLRNRNHRECMEFFFPETLHGAAIDPEGACKKEDDYELMFDYNPSWLVTECEISLSPIGVYRMTSKAEWGGLTFETESGVQQRMDVIEVIFDDISPIVVGKQTYKTSISVIHQDPSTLHYGVVTFPLRSGGRSDFLAQILAAGFSKTEKRDQKLVAKERSFDLAHLVYSEQRFWRFEDECPYLAGIDKVTWFVADAPASASCTQLNAFKVEGRKPLTPSMKQNSDHRKVFLVLAATLS